MTNLLIVGAHGHGKVVLECALSTGKYTKISFMSNEVETGGIDGYELLDQNRTSFEYIRENFDEVIVAVGLNNSARLNLSNKLEAEGIKLATIIHKTAIVSQFSEIGDGTVVSANAIINPFTKIGKACIIGTAAVVGHDCRISDGVHLSPNATVAGSVHIGKHSWMCMGCNVIHEMKIGENSIVAAGATVINDVPDNVLVAGVPATVKKSI